MKTKNLHTASSRKRVAEKATGAHTVSGHTHWVVEALPRADAVRAFAAWQTMGEMFSHSQPSPLPVIR